MPVTNAYLLLGSNLGDRAQNLEIAEKNLERRAGNVVNKSSFYETAAWGNENQPSFFNRALHITTVLQPVELLRTVKEIEKAMGRTQNMKWGSRLIDIDILLMDETVFRSPSLEVPHPQMHKRRFTLVPLAEIAGDIIHPVFNLTIRDLLEKCDDPLDVKKIIGKNTMLKD